MQSHLSAAIFTTKKPPTSSPKGAAVAERTRLPAQRRNQGTRRETAGEDKSHRAYRSATPAASLSP